MRIEAITGRKVVVELSCEDMEQLGITYEALDYASVDTRRVIWIILDRVRESTGCDIDPSGQLLIDAMPRPTGGCILFFTIKGGGGCIERMDPHMPERVLRKQDALVATFEFENIDSLLDCAAAYARALHSGSERLYDKNELYTKGGRFRLLLSPAQELSRVRQFFCEFALFCGENAFAANRTREHWQHLGEGGCFERMGGTGPRLPQKRASPQFSPGNIYAEIS